MMESVEEKKEKEIETKNEIRKLEEFYVNGTVSNLLEDLESKKEEIVDKMVKYAQENHIPTKYDKFGDPIEYTTEIKPVVISNYFFKSIVPINSQIPLYSPEQISLAFDYFMDLITEVNVHIGNFPPSLSLFAKFIGVSMTTLRNYKNSADMNMRNIMEKIYDEIGNNNLTMSQIGVSKERSTLFRLKTENEMVEKVQPNVNITYKATINKEEMESKLDRYKALLDKKGR